jgi:hypothetical protein
MEESLSNSPRLEILRTSNAEEVELAGEVLTTAGIGHTVSSSRAGFDYSAIGRSDVPPDLILTVAREDYTTVSAALEQAFSASELPDDHFLRTASDDEVLAILASPGEWSPFDVAHARKLASQRNLDPAILTVRQAERREALERGKSAPHWLLILGWASAFLGGVIGIGIGYSLANMREKTPDGDFYTYDEVSRRIGRRLLFFSLFMLVAVRLLWVLYRAR